MAAAERHLAVSSTAAALREVVNGIDALDVDASHTLQLKLHTLRAAIEQRLVEQENGAEMTAFDDADDAADQRTRLLMIEAEIPSADDATLVALDREVATLTLLPAIERDWMAEQIEVEVRRRSS